MSLAGNSTNSYSASLTPAQRSRLEKALQAWVDAKSYRIPDTTLEQSAARMGTQSVILYRYFLEKGQDFRTWRSQLRIKDAQQELLAFPEEPASAIARRVGFTDRSNFTRQFKAFTGLTPELWRKNQK
jgi:AraC-like DNA-binding protein